MAKPTKILDISILQEWFDYDPETGQIRWIKQRTNARRAGELAGNIDKKSGYLYLWFNYKKYYGHRVAWALHYGEWPTREIDHVNRNRSDNRIVNLRQADHSQNLFNKPKATPVTGFVGVQKNHNRYSAFIYRHKKRIYLGTYDTAEEASKAYQLKAKELYGEFFGH